MENRIDAIEQSLQVHEEVLNRHEEVVNRHEEVVNRHEESINHQWEVQKWHEERLQRVEKTLIGKIVARVKNIIS